MEGNTGQNAMKATIFNTVFRIQLLDINTIYVDICRYVDTVTPAISPGYSLVCVYVLNHGHSVNISYFFQFDFSFLNNIQFKRIHQADHQTARAASELH